MLPECFGCCAQIIASGQVGVCAAFRLCIPRACTHLLLLAGQQAGPALVVTCKLSRLVPDRNLIWQQNIYMGYYGHQIRLVRSLKILNPADYVRQKTCRMVAKLRRGMHGHMSTHLLCEIINMLGHLPELHGAKARTCRWHAGGQFSNTSESAPKYILCLIPQYINKLLFHPPASLG